MSVASPHGSAGERLATRADSINPKTFESINQLKEICIPHFTKAGYSVLDGEAMLEAIIRYGWAQAIEDKIINLANLIKIRPLEPSDMTYDKDYNFLTFSYEDKVVVIYGLEDTTKLLQKYPIKRVGFERYMAKIIDVVDVEDLYHTNYVAFLTPILYRAKDRAGITFDGSFSKGKPKPDGLKINGLVFSK